MVEHEDARTEFAGRGERDDRIHAVLAGDDALLDPSPYSTRCGQAVLEVYNGSPEVTCPECAQR